jgi:Uma2 family endonuclease
LQAKLTEYLDNGVKLGWIVDALLSQVHIYEAGKPVQVLDRPATVSGTGCVAGFVLDLQEIFTAAE